MIDVTLAPHEAAYSGTAGLWRQINAFGRGLKSDPRAADPYEAGNHTIFDSHILGAMGEFATAKAFNLYWAPNIGVLNAPDVGGIIEVRTRDTRRGRDLYIMPDDKDHAPYVLVWNDGRSLTFTLVGWLLGREAKARVRAFAAAYAFVPPPYHPMNTLTEFLQMRTRAPVANVG